jgi:hypothetical protein
MWRVTGRRAGGEPTTWCGAVPTQRRRRSPAPPGPAAAPGYTLILAFRVTGFASALPANLATTW